MRAVQVAGVCCLSSLLVLSAASRAAAAEPTIKRILVLHHYGQEALFRATFDPAIQEALRTSSSGPVDVYVEATESYRFPSAVESGLVRDFLKAKYAGRKIDVVIAVADTAVNFARQNRDVFGGAPIVAFVTRASLEAGDDQATGLQEELGIRGTLDLALKLEPGTERVFVVDGVLQNSGDIETEFRNQIVTFEPHLELVYLRDLPMADLIARIQAIPDRSIVFFARQAILDRTTSLAVREGLAQVVRASPVPIFTFTAEQIGWGPVGGDVWQVKTDAKRLADMALRIADGASPRDIPPGHATMMPTLDWRQLRRWRIPQDRVPVGTLLLFREPSFMELYGRYVVGGVLIFTAQLALIGTLLVQRGLRRRAEARSKAMLRAVPDLMFMLRRDGTYVDYHAKDRKLLFAPPSKFLQMKVGDIMPPKLADMFMDAIERACRSDDTSVVEYELPLDETRHFEARIVRAGEDRVLSMVRDVTESKRAVELNRDLAGRLIASQEVERQRIARELHDDLSQKIALLNIEIDQVAGEIAAAEPRSRLRQISSHAGEIASDVHSLSRELHPSKLQKLGLQAALQLLCRDMSELGSAEVVFTHGMLPRVVDPNVSLCVYRIAQEALHNVVRHSQAGEAHVHLTCDNDSLVLQIGDSGVGFDPQAQQAGLGLLSMRERVAFLRGELAIHASPGGGTRIIVRVPLTPQGAASVLPIGDGPAAISSTT